MLLRSLSLVALGFLTVCTSFALPGSQLKDLPKDGHVIVYNETDIAFKLQQASSQFQQPKSGVFGAGVVVQPHNNDSKAVFADIQPVTDPSVPYCTSDHPCVGVEVLFRPQGFRLTSPPMGVYAYNTASVLVDYIIVSPCEVMINKTPVFISGWISGNLSRDVVYTISRQDPGEVACPLTKRDI